MHVNCTKHIHKYSCKYILVFKKCGFLEISQNNNLKVYLVSGVNFTRNVQQELKVLISQLSSTQTRDQNVWFEIIVV